MDGLLPMMFKAIKKSKTRRQYECLSSRAAESYNISDFYLDDQNHSFTSFSDRRASNFHTDTNGHHHHHRRYNSVGEFPAVERGRSVDVTPKVEKQFVRFRSQRMFSCVAGCVDGVDTSAIIQGNRVSTPLKKQVIL